MAQPCDIDYLMYEHHTLGLLSVWPDIWSQNKLGHCDIYFTVHWFCLISWRLFDVWASYFAIMSHYDPTFDLKINVGHRDLYFMAHWFCLLSWRLFDVRTSYFEIMSQYDSTFDLKINVSLCDLYFIVHWFCLISCDRLKFILIFY